MDQRAPIDRVPTWVRSYLLDWRNAHNEEFLKRYDRRGLKELTIYELDALYREATEGDRGTIGFVMQEIETEQSHAQK